MLAGPAAMSTVMVLSAQAHGVAAQGIVYAAIVAVMLISWISLRVSDRVFRKLGESGIRVATRVMGLILSAIAVQFVLSGMRDAGVIGPAPLP
jgi:multiple antibiotic resistance protein